MEQTDLRDVVREEVRRQVRSLFGRYLPLAAVGLVILLLVVLVPDARPSDGSGSLTSVGAPSRPSVDGTTGGQTTGSAPGSPQVPGSGTTGAGAVGGTSGSAPTGVGFTGATSGGGTGGGPSKAGGTGGAGAPSSFGVARNGTKCGAGVRQFTFSPYAPLCVPEFKGNNGGATSHGVDAKTITLALRRTSDYDTAAPAVGASSQAAIEADLKTLSNYFNTQYELYGRKVVVKAFDGSGSYISETAGQDQSGANADAQKEYDLGAFVDLGPPAPKVYANALAARKIIAFVQPVALADARASYPYKFQSLSSVPDLLARGLADMICQRMAGLPAVNAGDANLKSKKRTFALITSDSFPEGQGPNAFFARAKGQCGLNAQHYTYNANPAQGASQAAQIAGKLKADGVTTVVLNSDVIFSPTMTTAVAQQQYNPEWVLFGPNSNAAPRRMDAGQVSRMVFAFPWHPLSRGPSATESARIFKLASPNAGPQSNQVTLDLLIKPLIEFFNALQAAGPTLTPGSFGRGWFSQAPSAKPGDFGNWSFATDQFSPDASFTLQYWNASANNPYDGGTGTPIACNEPADIPNISPRLGSGQLRCFGN